jgi:hypothetical protein
MRACPSTCESVGTHIRMLHGRVYNVEATCASKWGRKRTRLRMQIRMQVRMQIRMQVQLRMLERMQERMQIRMQVQLRMQIRMQVRMGRCESDVGGTASSMMRIARASHGRSRGLRMLDELPYPSHGCGPRLGVCMHAGKRVLRVLCVLHVSCVLHTCIPGAGANALSACIFTWPVHDVGMRAVCPICDERCPMPVAECAMCGVRCAMCVRFRSLPYRIVSYCIVLYRMCDPAGCSLSTNGY